MSMSVWVMVGHMAMGGAEIPVMYSHNAFSTPLQCEQWRLQLPYEELREATECRKLKVVDPKVLPPAVPKFDR